MCPECRRRNRRLPLSRRKPLHGLPCPEHGSPEFYEDLALPLRLARLRLDKWQRAHDDPSQWERVPDFPAIWAALQIYRDADATQICDLLFAVWRQQEGDVHARTD